MTQWIGLVVAGFLAMPSVLSANSPEGESIPFGQVYVGAVTAQELVVPNTTNRPLLLKDVNSSCSDLRVVAFDRSIPPGKKGPIAVEYRPIKVGQTSVELLVSTDHSEEPLFTFRWKGEVLPAAGTQTEETSRTPSVFISPAELVASEMAATLLVDVRKPEQFNAVHAEASVNWPLELLRSLITAQKRPVVILGGGEDDYRIAREALALRSTEPSSVRVLRGGMRGWAMARLPVRGSNTKSLLSAMVEPTALFESPDDDWLILNLAGKYSVPASEKIPASIELPFGADEETAVADTISKAIALRPAASKILVVSKDGEQYEAFERNLPTGLGLPVFYLSGGTMGYRQFVGMQQAGRAGREIRLATSATTGNSQVSPGGALRVSANGCATCPLKRRTVR